MLPDIAGPTPGLRRGDAPWLLCWAVTGMAAIAASPSINSVFFIVVNTFKDLARNLVCDYNMDGVMLVYNM